MIRTTITLSSDHALVLYELIARLNAGDDAWRTDQAEQRVLWDLEAELESKVTAVLAPDYRNQVTAARQRIRDAED